MRFRLALHVARNDIVRKLISVFAHRPARPAGLNAGHAGLPMGKNIAEITPFPGSLLHVEGEPGARRTWVEDLDADLTRCYELLRLPSELGAAWAKGGREVDTSVYRQ